jgi:hypothetical protein
MAAVAGSCVMTNLVGAEAPTAPVAQPDPVLSDAPEAIRSIFEAAFPSHRYRCVRMARPVNAPEVFRGKFFDLTLSKVRCGQRGDEFVSEPIFYEMEVAANGKVVEETPRPVLDRDGLPKPVQAAYGKWNPKGVKGMFVHWYTSVPRGQERVYTVRILIDQLTLHDATFKEDGTVVHADPAVVP